MIVFLEKEINPMEIPEPSKFMGIEEARTVTLQSIGLGLASLAQTVEKMSATNTKRLEAMEAELKATKAEVKALKAKKEGQKKSKK